MATFVYRNAIFLVNGSDFTGALHDLNVAYSAEVLDATRFGDDTRRKKGGLFVGAISGKGWFDGAVGMDAVLFNQMGPSELTVAVNPAYQAGAQIEDDVFVVFPDGVTENSGTTGMGFACKGVIKTLSIAATVGQLLDMTFAAESRGILA